MFQLSSIQNAAPSAVLGYAHAIRAGEHFNRFAQLISSGNLTDAFTPALQSPFFRTVTYGVNALDSADDLIPGNPFSTQIALLALTLNAINSFNDGNTKLKKGQMGDGLEKIGKCLLSLNKLEKKVNS